MDLLKIGLTRINLFFILLLFVLLLGFAVGQVLILLDYLGLL